MEYIRKEKGGRLIRSSKNEVDKSMQRIGLEGGQYIYMWWVYDKDQIWVLHVLS